MAEQKADCPSFAITYFAMGGRAEPLRNAAAIGGIAFEDRFTTGEIHKKTKSEGGRRWGGLPELTVIDKDGKDLVTIGQSNTCLRYVGMSSSVYVDIFTY